ncbi:Cadherin-related tumor suppressor [Eumeta japonica]|uniref:Cadherin-related tumor suppressor n=1 Tax=Eumeta variegata TaxID=151549 RepID=A0A4C1WH34_EUMVA|nr:Cadherin-related tumor suppressor [Eumeta japonica]
MKSTSLVFYFDQLTVGFDFVTDTNDNPPMFQESAYSFDINENAARGSIVGRVSAADLDHGANAQLTYALVSDWANDVFSLNPHTGVFTLTSRLDYEERQLGHVVVVVGVKCFDGVCAATGGSGTVAETHALIRMRGNACRSENIADVTPGAARRRLSRLESAARGQRPRRGRSRGYARPVNFNNYLPPPRRLIRLPLLKALV